MNDRKSPAPKTLRLLKMLIALAAVAYLSWQGLSGSAREHPDGNRSSTGQTPPAAASSMQDIYDNGFWLMAYNEDREQPDWVSYELKRSDLNKKRFPRPDRYYPDRDIKTGSAALSDYKGSGYTRGHLVPQADVAWNRDAQKRSMRLSNMSPQTRACNGGIWRELEECVRDWARENETLQIMCGPIWRGGEMEIGQNEVDVPTAYWKAILDNTSPDRKAIAFIIPNEVSYKHLNKYCVSVDSLETLLGIDLWPDQQIESLESRFRMNSWPVENKRYTLRRDHWNKR